jgi:hypothetical protein
MERILKLNYYNPVKKLRRKIKMKNFLKKAIFAAIFTIPTVSVHASYDIISVDGHHVSVETVLVEERTLIQARSLVEALGGTINWNEEERLVTIHHDSTIQLTIDSSIAYVDGVEQELEVVPTIFNESTFLPLRFVAENLGFSIDFVDGMVTILTTAFVPPTLTYLQEQGLIEGLEATVLFLNQNLVGESIESGHYTVIPPMNKWGFFNVLDEDGNMIFTDLVSGLNISQFLEDLLPEVEQTTTVHLLDGHIVDLENFQYLLFLR